MSREIRLPAGTEYLKLNEVPKLMAWALCPYDTNDKDVLADIQYRIAKDECKKNIVESLVSGELVASHPVTPTPAREIFTDGIRPDDELLNEFLDLCRISIARLTKFCSSDDWSIKVIVDSAHNEPQAEPVAIDGADNREATEPESVKVNTVPKERELASWLRETWIKESKPGGAVFFARLKGYVDKKGSPIKEHYNAGRVAGIRWETSAGTTGEMKKKTILTKVSAFKRTP